MEEPNASPPPIEHHDNAPTSPLSNRSLAVTRVPDTLHKQDTAEPPRPRPRPRPKVQPAVSLVEPTPSSSAAPFTDAPVQGDTNDPEDAIVPRTSRYGRTLKRSRHVVVSDDEGDICASSNCTESGNLEMVECAGPGCSSKVIRALPQIPVEG
jgi:hypothetical protein